MTPANLAATPELQSQAFERVRSALHGPSRFEWRHRRRDGYQFPVEISTQPFTLDGQPYTFAQAHDITERKQAEDTLREAKKFAEDLIATMQDGFSVIDQRGVHIDVNLAFSAMTGFAREELIGVGAPHPYWPPECLPEIARAFDRTLHGERSSFELTFMRKGGERFPVIVCPACIHDAQGQIVYYFATVKDITERKRAEETLEQSARELQRSNAELEGFAYAASHDLQEPLRMVASFVGLLQERYQGRLDSDADEFIGFAVDGAKRMQRLIDDLLEYSRVATRGQSPQPTDAAAALDEALWNLTLAIEDAGATVTRDPLPAVLADPTQLMQLFQNLIGNALKFRGSEPPVVHVSARQMDDVRSTMDDVRATMDDVRATMDDVGLLDDKSASPIAHRTSNIVHPPSGWVFSVRDNGIGIAPENHDRIFGVFQRLHSQAEYPGSGIGLAVCQKIVARHGGRLWVLLHIAGRVRPFS
jgi:PAS domain S-box-containing protein